MMMHNMNVAVRFIAYDLMTPSMMKMIAGMKLFEKNASIVETRLKNMRSLMMGGAGAAAIGFFGAYEIGKFIQPASQYVHLLSQANAMGMTHQEIAQGVQKAWETTAKVQTVSINESLKMLMDLRYALGSTDLATKYLSDVARIKTVYAVAAESGLSKNAAANPTEMAYSSAKALEMLGKTTSAEVFRNGLERMARVTVGTAGRVTALDYQTFAKYSRQAGFTLNDDFLYGILPTLIQEQKSIGGGAGGARGGPGAMVAAFYRFALQGIISKKVTSRWSQLGLMGGGTSIPASQRASLQGMENQFLSQASKNQPLVIPKGAPSMGSLLNISPLKGSQLAGRNLFEWEMQYLIPAIRKKYPKANNEQVLSVINALFSGNQLAAALMGNMFMRSSIFEKNARMLGGVMGVSDIVKMSQKDPNAAYATASAQWETLRVALGRDFVVLILQALTKLAGWLNHLAEFFMAHPTLAKDLIAISGSLAVLLGVGGLVTLMVALVNPISLVVMGIIGLTAAITALAEKTSFFSKLGSFFGPSVYSANVEGMLTGKEEALFGRIGSGSIATRSAASFSAVGDVFIDGIKMGKHVLRQGGDAISDSVNAYGSGVNHFDSLVTTSSRL